MADVGRATSRDPRRGHRVEAHAAVVSLRRASGLRPRGGDVTPSHAPQPGHRLGVAPTRTPKHGVSGTDSDTLRSDSSNVRSNSSSCSIEEVTC